MLSGTRILVADDDLHLLRAVASALSRLGADVTRAANGAELLYNLTDKGPFDLVVADIGMPWMTGVQAMLATRTAVSGTAIIIITGLPDESVLDSVSELGEHTVLLRKPFDLNQLESAVTTLLEQHSRARAANNKT
ncbi:MAG TPA: response regulator [Vicinamibacterales bacterium]|jgi:DNA-binding response OmpR family regulator